MFKLAMYKGRGNLFDAFIRFWDGGNYSHCELVFSNGLCASASFRDGQQVRLKPIQFDESRWDFLELPAELEVDAWKFFNETEGAKYDLIGQIRFLVSPMRGQKKKYWCSEWVAAALGLQEPYRYGPNGLYATLCSFKTMEAK